MNEKALQDYYPDDWSYCYGCGRLNDQGLHIKSYWDEEKEESICHFQPRPYHLAIPGFVYGGMIASLIDCHATGTAVAAGYQAEGRKIGTEPPLRYVTASIHVDYLKPTPIGTSLELKGKIKEVKGRKVVVFVTLSANQVICAQGEVVTVQIPESMMTPPKK
jgi:acyl-coenzyme A thioesterase PaaI-like protein